MSDNTKQISLKEYWNALNTHDWFYSFSDDQRAWKKGSTNGEILKEVSKQSPAHQELYEGFVAHHNIYSETTSPKPPCPQ